MPTPIRLTKEPLIMSKHTVVIVETATGEIVKTSDVTGWSERRIDKLMDGMSINLNWDAFHIEQRTPETEES